MEKLTYCFDQSKYRFIDDPNVTIGADWRRRVFESVVSNVASTVFPGGLNSPSARSLNRVLTALDVADGDFLLLEPGDIDFLKSIFFNERAAVPPLQARVFCLLQDEIQRASEVVAANRRCVGETNAKSRPID